MAIRVWPNIAATTLQDCISKIVSYEDERGGMKNPSLLYIRMKEAHEALMQCLLMLRGLYAIETDKQGLEKIFQESVDIFLPVQKDNILRVYYGVHGIKSLDEQIQSYEINKNGYL